LHHLVNNALQHGLSGRTAGCVGLRAVAAGEHIVIEVSDDGAGVAGPDLARVFEPFFTTRMAGGHYGLGLSISYNIITHRLGGDITFDSEAGAGTRVCLLLPQRRAAS
jgi:signal transduction histidine kinase